MKALAFINLRMFNIYTCYITGSDTRTNKNTKNMFPHESVFHLIVLRSTAYFKQCTVYVVHKRSTKIFSGISIQGHTSAGNVTVVVEPLMLET